MTFCSPEFWRTKRHTSCFDNFDPSSSLAFPRASGGVQGFVGPRSARVGDRSLFGIQPRSVVDFPGIDLLTYTAACALSLVDAVSFPPPSIIVLFPVVFRQPRPFPKVRLYITFCFYYFLMQFHVQVNSSSSLDGCCFVSHHQHIPSMSALFRFYHLPLPLTCSSASAQRRVHLRGRGTLQCEPRCGTPPLFHHA